MQDGKDIQICIFHLQQDLGERLAIFVLIEKNDKIFLIGQSEVKCISH